MTHHTAVTGRLAPAVRVSLVAAALIAAACVAEADGSKSWRERLNIFGDFRLRYEANTEVVDGPDPDRGVLRFRLVGSYRPVDTLELGVRLVTGNPDNPRTNDVDISDFFDDPQLSFDRAYVMLGNDKGFATVGKMINPFATTELVWDGDVNPAGVAGGAGVFPKAGLLVGGTAMYMVVDEEAIDSGSTMWGGQLKLIRSIGSGRELTIAAAYWDYDISGLSSPLEATSYRGNLLTPDGTSFLSDFDLLDLRIALSLPVAIPKFPLLLVADVVKNLGAAVDEDEGFELDVTAGQPWTRRRFVFRYGYAQCETDAVFGTLSNDNLPVATNYRNHTLKAAYGLFENTTLSWTWYYFRQLHGESTGYRSRVRLDLMVRF